MNIAGLARTSTVDFPGRLAAVVFFASCNYDCFYCHNRAIIGGAAPLLPPGEVELFLQKRADVLDGVVVSGGEATMSRALPDFLSFCRRLGYATKLDTNGSRPDVVEYLLNARLLDYAAVDYKAPRHRYKEVCGESADPGAVAETIGILLRSDIPFEARTTVFPGLAPDLPDMARALPVLPRYALNGYRRPAIFKPEDAYRVELPAYTAGEMEGFRREVLPFQPNTVVGTI